MAIQTRLPLLRTGAPVFAKGRGGALVRAFLFIGYIIIYLTTYRAGLLELVRDLVFIHAVLSILNHSKPLYESEKVLFFITIFTSGEKSELMISLSFFLQVS